MTLWTKARRAKRTAPKLRYAKLRFFDIPPPRVALRHAMLDPAKTYVTLARALFISIKNNLRITLHHFTERIGVSV